MAADAIVGIRGGRLHRRPRSRAISTPKTAETAASARAPAPSTVPKTARPARIHLRRPLVSSAPYSEIQTTAADSSAHDDGFVDPYTNMPRGTAVTMTEM